MLNKLFDLLSPSGAEEKIRDFIKHTISERFDSVSVDNIGNLVAHKTGSGAKICVECGMDSRGIMLVAAEKNTASFAGVGQLKPSYLINQKIIMSDGTLGIVRCGGEASDSTKLSDLTLEYDNETLKIGDFGIVYPDFAKTETKILANGLSDIIGLAAVIEAITTADIKTDLTVVFSAQKVLGGRGIRSFFGTHSFDKVFTIVGVECKNGTKNGDGCAVIVKDKTAVASIDLKRELEVVSAADSIKTQPCVSDESFYLGSISHTSCGNPCIALGVPILHKNKAFECADICDFDETVRLIRQIIGG